MRITSKQHLRRNKVRLELWYEMPGVRITYPDRGNGNVVRYVPNGKRVVGDINYEAIEFVEFS